MDRPLRVCMVTYKAPPVHTGAGQQALRLASALQARGVEPMILTARQSRDLPARESLRGVPIVRLPVLGRGRLQPASFALGTALYLCSRLRSYDILHFHGAYWHLYPALLVAQRHQGARSVVKLTLSGSDDPQTIAGRQMGWLLLRALAAADTVVAMTEELAESYRLAGLPAEKMVQLPNGVDTRRFRPVGRSLQASLRAKLGIPATALVVVFVGVVKWLKGADVLLEAWDRVHESIPSAVLYLVGPFSPRPDPDGRLFSEMAQGYAATRAQRARVRFAGRRADVHEWFQAADAFVLPSRAEGLPNALLEAMACGLPVVATNIGGMAEVVRDGANGLTVPAGDAGALAAALVRVLEDRQVTKALGQAARASVMERFSIGAVADRYAELYRSLTTPLS